MSVQLIALTSPAHSGGGGGLSTTAVVLIVLAGLLLVGCAVWGLAQAQAWEPRWSLRLPR